MTKVACLSSALRFPASALGACLAISCSMSASASTSRFESQPAIDLPGPTGAFDFMACDPTADRILAAHRGASTLEILDLTTGKPLAAVNVGAAQGVAVDAIGYRYFVGNEWVYSFDIRGADRQIHEVLVNAQSGKIIESTIESPAKEAKEAASESKD